MTHNKIIKLLAILGALFAGTLKASETENLKPGMTLLSSSEQNGLKSNYTEITLKPDVTWKKGEYKVGYYGSFYRATDTKGPDFDWMTLASKIRAENDDWALEIGRSNTRAYPGYIYAPTTIGFDNLGMIKGTARTYTGTMLTHKGTGLTLGQVADDTRMTPTHWDSTLVGWTTELNDEWALQLQTTGGRRPLSSAGATLKWEPDDKTALVAEAFYQPTETTGILTVNRKLRDDLTLFAGGLISKPDKEKADGLATMGASYKIGRGFSVVVAAHQKLGTERTTSAILGIKYAGDFRQR